MSRSSSAMFAFAKSAAERYFLNRVSVTMLTRLSVHCAERIVATKSSSGLAWFNSQCAPGYAFCKPAMTFFVRAIFAALDSRAMTGESLTTKLHHGKQEQTGEL